MRTKSYVSSNSNDLTQVDKFQESARELETDDDEARFDERLKKLVKHQPVEKAE